MIDAPEIIPSTFQPALRGEHLVQTETDGAGTRPCQRAYFALFATYIILGVGARLLGWWYGDAIWFVWAARHVLDNSFDLYSLHLAPELAPPIGITYSYTPLLAVLVAGFVAAADALQLGDEGAYRAMALPLIALDVVAKQELRRLVTSWRPAVDQRFLFLGIAISLFLTSFLSATAYRGHVEGLVLLFILLTLRFLPRNLILAGLFAGLALSAKHTTALFALLPIGLVMLSGGRTIDREGEPDVLRPQKLRRAWRDTSIWAGIALTVFAAFLAPPLVRNPDAVYYAFVTLPNRLVSFGPGLTHWIDRVLAALLKPADFITVRPLLLSISNLFVVALPTLLMLYVIVRARARKQPFGLVDVRLIGLIAFALVANLVLAKWVSEHYYPLPLAMVFVWDMLRVTRPGPRRGPLTLNWDNFPWVGVGAAIAYKSLTQLDASTFPSIGISSQSWLGDAVLFVLFAALAGLMWRGLEVPDNRPGAQERDV